MPKRHSTLRDALERTAETAVVRSRSPGESLANPLPEHTPREAYCVLCAGRCVGMAAYDLGTQLALEEVSMVPVDAIDVGEQLIRSDQDDDDIIELAADIARRGLLHPIIVARSAGGRYQLRAGGRRLQAHRRLGRSHIRASISVRVEQSIRGVALAENLLRKQMSLGDECAAVRQMHVDEDLSVETISTLCGKSRQWVLRRLMVHELPADLSVPLLEGRISLGAAEAIALLPDIGARSFLVQQVEQCRASISQTEEMVRSMLAAPNLEEAVQAGLAVKAVPAVHTQIFLGCQGCSAPTPPEQLITLRVCAACLAGATEAKE